MNALREQRSDAARMRRARADQIAVFVCRNRLAAMPQAEHARVQALLRDLVGRIERNDFTDAERLEARAALVDGSPIAAQRSLPLGTSHG